MRIAIGSNERTNYGNRKPTHPFREYNRGGMGCILAHSRSHFYATTTAGQL